MSESFFIINHSSISFAISYQENFYNSVNESKAESLPEAIDSDLAKVNGNTLRLKNKESDLNSIIFANNDGSESIYIFNEPVKFINERGEVQDKSNQLYNTSVTGYSYINKDNDIQTLFLTHLNEQTSIKLNYKSYSIMMYPIVENHSNNNTTGRVELRENSVFYNNAFGTNTSLCYKTTFSGLKEDIVLYNPGDVDNVFSFMIKCDQLIPKIEDNIVVFYENNSDNMIAYTDPVLVRDSFSGEIDNYIHETWNNTVTLDKNSDNSYIITITVDKDFICSEKVTYPIFIDPSITINSTGNGSAKTIVDTPIYNGSGVTGISSGANSSAVIGRVGNIGGVEYGTGRLLMKFPGLMNKSFMSNQNYYINSAKLYLTEASGNTADAIVSAYIYTGPSWSETSVYSSGIWGGIYRINGLEQTLSSFTYSFPNSTFGNFDITDAVRLWQSNSSYGNKGIMLRNRTNEINTTYYKSLYTSESTTKPYLYVSYTNRSTASDAYHDLGISSKSFSIQLFGTSTMDSTWISLINASCNSWNNSNANTHITTTTGSSPYMIVVSEYPEESWYGRTSLSLTGTTAIIEINLSTVSSSSLFRRSIITHEIGHLLWLTDNPSVSDYSLMNHQRDRYLIYTPQAADIYHVMQKYS